MQQLSRGALTFPTPSEAVSCMSAGLSFLPSWLLVVFAAPTPRPGLGSHKQCSHLRSSMCLGLRGKWSVTTSKSIPICAHVPVRYPGKQVHKRGARGLLGDQACKGRKGRKQGWASRGSDCDADLTKPDCSSPGKGQGRPMRGLEWAEVPQGPTEGSHRGGSSGQAWPGLERQVP